MHCVNRNIPEFKLLTDQSGLSEEALAAKVSVWQDRHNTDAIPSMVELYNSPNQGIKYQLPKQQSDSIDNVFDENLELAEAIYEGLGFKGRKIKSFDIFSEIEKNTKREDLKKITPQQKQQAKEVYQQYLDSELGSKQDIQQVKEFISSRNNQGNNQSLQEGLNWLESVNPNVQPEIVQGLIDGIANGSYNSKLDLITLSEEFANKKTIKHEYAHLTIGSLFETEEHYVLDKLIKKEEIKENCTGKLKAEKGLQTNFTKGGKWKMIKDLKGYPTHKEGGVDLTIGKDGVSIKNGNTQFTAKHGLVIPKAQDGLTIPSWLNPKNWGVTDYSDKGDFNTAYSTARKDGKKEFLFKDKRYSTAMKPIAGDVVQKREDFEGNFMSKTSIQDRDKWYKGEKLSSFYEYFAGLPLTDRALMYSKYKPQNSKDKNKMYIGINDEKLKQDLWEKANYAFDPETREKVFGRDRINIIDENNVNFISHSALGHSKFSRGKDDRGDYYSIYDVFDVGTGKGFLGANIGETVGANKSYEIYDRMYYKDYNGTKKRMYYTDKELSELNIDKKDFDTLALQKELVNRGYKLPKSTKKDYSLDGVWGDETKNALLEYRKSQNKN